jgi:hypothetical protein
MWSDDLEAAKNRDTDSGQVLAEVMCGYFQVISWDAMSEVWRENTNHLALRKQPLRWRAIN